jgi:hypothetical protein
MELAPDLPFIPMLHGWELADYLECAAMYEAAGVDLAAVPPVGVGSVCRRRATEEIGTIMKTLAGKGLKLHGFGVKTEGLRRYGQYLASADSMAWSLRGRHMRLPSYAPRAARALLGGQLPGFSLGVAGRRNER